MRNKCLSGILAFFLFLLPFSHGLAEMHPTPPTVKNVSMEKDGNCLSYPQLTGWQDQAAQSAINDDLFLSANVAAHMVTFATLTPDSLWGLQVTYQAYTNERVASFIISAEGKMPNGRQGQVNTALSYDLTTGRRLTAAELFADAQAAQEWLEEQAMNTLGEEISDYEDSSVLLPLPMNSFYLDADGITFCYAPEQFTTIAGQAGACHFQYAEIQHLLSKDAMGIPAQAGLLVPALDQAQQQKAVQAAAQAGRIDPLPIALGQPMTQIVEAHGLTRTPDEFPGGRYFVMEDPQFRSILLISDAMQSSYDHSVLEGIQLRRGAFAGFLVGQATRQAWLDALGQPDTTITMTENMAYDYNLPTGTCDVYAYEGASVRFYADEAGLLAAVQLEQN